MANEWRDTLLAFRVKFEKKYGKSLGVGGSGNWVKDASKKIFWLKEKEDIIELRRRISTASSAIQPLVLAAMGSVISSPLLNGNVPANASMVQNIEQTRPRKADLPCASCSFPVRRVDEKTDHYVQDHGWEIRCSIQKFRAHFKQGLTGSLYRHRHEGITGLLQVFDVGAACCSTRSRYSLATSAGHVRRRTRLSDTVTS